jgi:hypothetical protein
VKDAARYTDIIAEYPKEKVHLWPYHQITDDLRLHYKVIDYDEADAKTDGFYFCSVRWTGNECNGEDDQWKNETTTVDVLLNGTSYFDGIRHLYFGSEQTNNYGYFYYPDTDEIFMVLDKLVKMESKHCWDSEKRMMKCSPSGTAGDEK